MEHIPGAQGAHRADCKVKLYGVPKWTAPNHCNCEELDKAQYSVSQTRQDLQDQLDDNSKLIVRLTEALRTQTERAEHAEQCATDNYNELEATGILNDELKDALRKSEEEKGVLLAAAVRASQDINWMLNNRQFLNSDVFDYLHKALTSVNP